MPRDPESSTRREQLLVETRRRLTRLEIEAHRIKAELARLEAENETDLADQLASALGDATTNGHGVDRSPARFSVEPSGSQHAKAGPGASTPEPTAPHENGAPSVRVVAVEERSGSTRRRKRNSNRRRKKLAPAWGMSLAVHAAVLALLAPMGYVILANDDVPLFASMLEPEATHVDPSVVPVEMVSVEDQRDVHEALFDDLATPLADTLADELAPLASDDSAEPAPTAGALNALPTDVGTLMAGGGSEPGLGAPDDRPRRNEAAGKLGRTTFFGTPVQANRVVFVIDNSSSMKNGRLEKALEELVISVESMTLRQSFYVIFVSDQPYPMFYPQAAPALVPATKQNKRLLREWLGRVILASGKNREIITAMDMAAALGPEAVFLLWDGDMKYSDKVRRDVLTHLTRPNQWRFAIHTLGMGVTSLDAEYNLTTIAQANGGTYRPVPIPATAR